MLDRDELAARCLVAMMSNSASRGRPDEFASDAVTFSDALLARLAETAPAPVAPAAPAVPPARPKRVRVTALNGDAGAVTVGRVYDVLYWYADGSPRVINDRGEGWYLCGDGDPRSDTNIGLPTWEPADETPAAPAPAPVAYVPKVGDKVEFGAVFADEKSGVVVAVDEARQVASIVPFGESPSRPKWERYFCDVRMIGVATDVERLAAGLPPIAPTAPASREAVARALREAYQQVAPVGAPVGPWESMSEESRNGYLAEADAALALLIPGARWPEAKS